MRQEQREPQIVLPAGAHYGDVGLVRRLGELVVAESSYRAGSRTPRHTHQTASFTLVIEGSYVEEFSRSRLECTPGTLLFRPAQETHRDVVGSAGARCLMLEIAPDWLRHLAAGGLQLGRPVQARDHHGFAARIRRELTLADELTALVIEALAMELACDLQREPSRRSKAPRWLEQVRGRVEAEFSGLPTLAALATEAGVHPTHLARAFRRHYGATIGEYARRQRIAFCCEQLQHGAASLADIAAAAGFASQAHFTRSFKLETRLTPGEYRRLQAPACQPGAKTPVA